MARDCLQHTPMLQTSYWRTGLLKTYFSYLVRIMVRLVLFGE